MDDRMRPEYFECACYSPDHTFRFTINDVAIETSDDIDLLLEVQLNEYPGFFKRIWVAIRYIFGYKCRYGHWDCAIVRSEDVERLEQVLQTYKQLKEIGVVDVAN
jgi:hypothetical protein